MTDKPETRPQRPWFDGEVGSFEAMMRLRCAAPAMYEALEATLNELSGYPALDRDEAVLLATRLVLRAANPTEEGEGE